MKKVEGYIESAEKFIIEAEDKLNSGDLRQAGEKYWGAAAQIVKAYAQWREVH